MKANYKYPNQAAVMSTAMKHNGAVMFFPTRGEALKFRQLCYKWRKLLREEQPDNPYEVISIPDPVLTTEEKWRLIMNVNTSLPEIYNLEGVKIQPELDFNEGLDFSENSLEDMPDIDLGEFFEDSAE